MSTLIIDDAREYIFPLFLVESQEDGVLLESRIYLGTAFFVSECGDAITANHILPEPDNLPHGKRVVAIVQQGSEHKCVG